MFEVTAKQAGETIVASRVGRNAAMALADRWAEKGYSDIGIIDANGRLRDRPEFRKLLWAKYQTKFA